MKVAVPPITIIPSNPSEEFVLPALDYDFQGPGSWKAYTSIKRHSHNPSKLKAVATI